MHGYPHHRVVLPACPCPLPLPGCSCSYSSPSPHRCIWDPKPSMLAARFHVRCLRLLCPTFSPSPLSSPTACSLSPSECLSFSPLLLGSCCLECTCTPILPAPHHSLPRFHRRVPVRVSLFRHCLRLMFSGSYRASTPPYSRAITRSVFAMLGSLPVLLTITCRSWPQITAAIPACTSPLT